MNITDKDIKLVKEKGITLDKIMTQVEIFKKGIPSVVLKSAATINEGIYRLSNEEKESLLRLYETKLEKLDTIKFVPASGAATRMFKDLFRFLDTYDYEKERLNSYTNYQKATAIRLFLIGLEKFPFYDKVMAKIQKWYPKFNELSEGKQLYLFVETMLRVKGLNYGAYPKGLLPFHKYSDEMTTAFEEHLYEAVGYGTANGKAKLHFTIGKDHLEAFEYAFEDIRKKVEKKTGVDFDITYSFQKSETDTVAVTMENKLFRKENGEVLFRPGGHGALIENLNDLEADIIFIKNIDNVVVRKYQDDVADYKKVLAGKLIEIQNKIFEILKEIDKCIPSEEKLLEIKEFMEKQLNIMFPYDFDKFSEEFKLDFLRSSLNRPIRVCGMVENEGEPGGGPFWVKGVRGRITLQIIETAQINKNDERQLGILKRATHFNPVDIVCGVKNYKGEKFDLRNYIDETAGFITIKSIKGEKLKALELPGLWNGAMANWISVFVEVPLTTFNPVKTINDLLKSAHQVKLFS